MRNPITKVVERNRTARRITRVTRPAVRFVRRTRGLPLLAVPGGYLAYRAVRPHQDPSDGISVERTVTVNRPASELYAFWRNFEHLPRFMDHLETVLTTANGQSHWVAKAPLGASVEWNAEIIEERSPELIAWRSLPGAQIPNAGTVRFRPATGNRGTEVKVQLTYNPPGGKAGAAVAKLFGQEPDQQVREDLRRFKQVMEAGEVPTTEGQPSGREPKYADDAPNREQSKDWREATDDVVEEASEDSFPASDPPAYTTGQKDEDA